MGQERSNWTYCQYKGHLTHIKETHKDALSDNKERYKDCQKNMNTQHFSSWTNTRQMDKSKFFPLYFFNRTWDNVFYVADTSSNMHGTHKNSPYGQTNQKNSLFFGFFLHASSDKLALQILRSRTKKKSKKQTIFLISECLSIWTIFM